MTIESPWLTPAQAVEYLAGAFSVETICDACRLGKLRHTRPGGKRILTKREWLDDWCMARVEGGRDEKHAA